VALQRRLLRFAAEQLGATIDFPATEGLRLLALTGRAGQKLQFAQGLQAERSPRELRLRLAAEAELQGADAAAEYSVAIPGEVTAPLFGLRLRIEVEAATAFPENEARSPEFMESRAYTGSVALLRNWRPGDRVRLRYSSGPRKVKEVLERLRVTGSARALWPVLELDGHILWMQGVEVEPAQGIRIESTRMDPASA
jgi:tRNA(Ile)-lysidine synthase